MKDLTIICFIHNISTRGYARVGNFLKSLRGQDSEIYPRIILVDMSNDESFKHVNRYCKEWKAMHIYCKWLNPIWNKPLGLNIGLKHSETEYTMFTDIDYIFAPNFLSTLKANADQKNFLLCRTHDSPSSVNFDIFEMPKYDTVLQKSKLHPEHGDGACQCALTRWFKKIGGYDERIKLWGVMDNDMHRRAKLAKKNVVWINGATSIIHQWHPNFKERLFMSVEYKRRNRERLSEKTVGRNPSGWGNFPISDLRDYN